MAGSTSGGISDLAFVMNMRIDESSVSDSMRTLGDMKSKMSTTTFSATDSGGSTSSQDIADTKFAMLQQQVAELEAVELEKERAVNAAKRSAINEFSSALASEEARAKQRYETEAQRIDRLYQKRRDNIAALQAMPGDPMDQSEVDALNKRNNQQAKRESTNVVRGIGEDIDARAASRLSAEEKIDEWERKHISNIQSLTHLSQTQADLAQSRVAKEAEAERVHLQEINLKSTLLKITNDIAAAEQRDMTFAEQQAALAQQRLQAINEAYGKFSQLTTLQQQEKQAAIDAVKNENMRAVTYHEEVEDAKKLKSLNDAMERSHVGVMKPMERITHEYEKQKKLINEITVAGSAENKALHAKNDIIKAGTIARETERGNLSDVGGFSKAGTRIQEFGRGFEDFTVGFSMAKTNIEGIAMGLRGSANNAAQLAASFNPMVGAAVAIGASLATVIVPMVARWLWDTKALEEAQDAWNDKLKESGKEQLKVAEALAKMRGVVRDEADKPEDKKGKDVLDAVKKAEKDTSDKANDAIEKQRAFATADAKAFEAERKATESKAKADEFRRTHPVFGAMNKFDQRILDTEAADKKNKEMAEADRKTAKTALDDADKDKQTAFETERKLKENNAAAIAQAETDIFNAEKQKQKDALDAMGKDELKKDQDRIKRKYDLEIERIKQLGFGRVDPRTQALEIGADAIRQNELEAARKKDREKQTSDEEQFDAYMAEKTERDKKIMLEQWQDENEFAGYLADKAKAEEAKRLDDALLANADQQDALQERIQNAGSAAGPSAAMVSGTQAAESAINRALSGSQSVEGTMKTQLKVLQEIHKDLQQQKQAKTVSL